MIERHDITSTDEWLAWRPHWINMSEIAIVMGEATWGSLAELYAEKKGLRPPRVDNTIFTRGRWGEAAVFQAMAEERRHWQLQRARVHVRDTQARIACTPDGFAVRPERDGIGVVEAKVISRSVFRSRWVSNDDDDDAMPPPAYRLQTLGNMMLNETSWGVLAVLVTGEFDWQLRLFDIEPDPIIYARIRECAAAFWRDYLDPGIMPPFEPQRDAELVRLLHPKDDGSEIDLSGDNRALAALDELIETQAALKRMNAQETSLKTELQAKLGDHSVGRFNDGRRISWKHQHRKAHVVAASDPRIFRVIKAVEA
jgi:predicted phage-related endonuclease